MDLYIILEKAVILEATGKDVVRYLHNRLTNEIRALPTGETTFAAALSPQGKTEAVFAICRLEEEKFLLVADGGDRTAIKKSLLRFVVADRVTVVDRSEDYRALHLYSLRQPPNQKILVHYEVRRSSVTGIDILLSVANLSTLTTDLERIGFQKLTTERAKELRYEAQIASFPDEIADLLLPEVNRPELISYNKGCYAGQEVVEKVAARGRTPKVVRFARASKEVLVAPGSSVTRKVDGTPVGTVIDSIHNEQLGTTIFSVHIKNDPALLSEGCSIEGCDAEFWDA